MKRRTLAAAALGAGSLALPLAALAGTTPIQIASQLGGFQEVPHQTVKNLKGSGQFTAQLQPTKRGYQMTWKLTYGGLTGAATSAYLHAGKPGKHGAALVRLCTPCKTGASGKAFFSPGELRLAKADGVYVNIRTLKNPAGEIRGQLKVKS